MPAFIVADIEVTDPQAYEEYRSLAATRVNAGVLVTHFRRLKTDPSPGGWRMARPPRLVPGRGPGPG
jgi:hypothetical protein